MINQQRFLSVLFVFVISLNSLHAILPGGCIVYDLACVEITDFDREKDFDQAKQLLQENWQELIGHNEPCTDQTVQAYAEYLFRDRRSANYRGYPLLLKTIKNSGGLIGFVGYVLYDSANNDRDYVGPYMMNPPMDRGHIEIVAIDSAYRKKGLAKKLLNYAIDDLTQKGAQKINVGVSTDNQAALRLYHTLSFTNVREYDNQTNILIKEIV